MRLSGPVRRAWFGTWRIVPCRPFGRALTPALSQVRVSRAGIPEHSPLPYARDRVEHGPELPSVLMG